MATKNSVLVIGLEPTLVDFTDPVLRAANLDAAKISAALDADVGRLQELGYDAHLCLTDLGETAEAVVLERLGQKQFDCIVIGAGVRTVPRHFLLFETLINVLHDHAPHAKLAFNTKPDDTAEAVQRWL